MPVTGIDSKEIVQIGIVVRDVEQSAARYAKIFGFDAPEIHVAESRDHRQAVYRGETITAGVKIAVFDFGRVQVELLQPLDTPSSWQEFLDQHGEGIHHIAFAVSDTDSAAASFAEYDYNILQQGLFTDGSGRYTYLDTDKDLGVVIELNQRFNTQSAPNSVLFPADKGIGTNIVCQVGIMVHDIEKTARRLVEVLGLAEPNIFSTPGYEVVKTTYNGAPSEATAKLAFFNAGQAQIELIEPDEKPSAWRAFLERNGEGAHHLAFPIKDTKRVTDYLGQHDVLVSQQGLYGDLSGIYTYYDSTQALGAEIELLENFPRK